MLPSRTLKMLTAGLFTAVFAAPGAATHLPARPGDVVTRAARSPWSDADRRAELLLAKARLALGGSAALNNVRSLILAREDRLTEKILFPDRIQTVLETPWGHAVVTQDGENQWSRTPELPGALAGLANEARPGSADLARSARLKIVRYSLKYLLRPPTGYVMQSRSVGQVTYGPVSGEAVEFIGPDGHWVLIVFDATTGLPSAEVSKVGGTPEIHGTHLIEHLRDFRPVGKILAPFQIAEYRLRLGKTEALATWRFTIEVNPPLTKSDFREPPPIQRQ